MKRYLNYMMAILIAASIAGCKSYAKFTIDKDPELKTDSMWLGTWKAVEDTDSHNFILIQSPYDLFQSQAKWHNMDTAERRKYLKKEFADDTTRLNFVLNSVNNHEAMYYEAYDRFMKENGWNYYTTYFNRHGKNPLYQQWINYFSEINGKRFLNFEYRYVPSFYGGPADAKSVEGYFFVRIISMNATYDTLTTAIVADSTLKYLKNSGEIRNRIARNVDNPAFYSDTVHFYRVNYYHASMHEAVKRAN